MTTKVAMIADYPESDRQIDGGVQAVTKYLVDAMAKMPEIELHILSFKVGLDSAVVKEERGFVRYSIPYSRFGVITGFRNDQAKLNAFLDEIRPDIVHSQGGGHQGILASRTDYPTVVTIHGILTQEIKFLPKFRQRIRTRLQVWLGERRYVRRATHTILISPYVADYYGAALSGKRYLIPNPIDTRFFNVERSETTGRILFLGRLCERKGVKELLHAISDVGKTDDLRVVLAGSLEDEKYVSELKTIVARAGLTNTVDFRGILDSSQILEELSRCACLVLPSYQETAPMVIQEAMACGVPMIASDICGIPYQIDDGKTGFLVPAGDTDVLADRLRTLLSNQVLRDKFSRAARTRAEHEYQATKVALKTISVYEDMLR
jgi:glycosyltransferase involved in cell wall biosynthesis